MPTQAEIKPGHVICLGCVFADHADPDRPKTQTSCVLGRDEVFRERGELLEAENEAGEFFVVNRPCNARRTKEWLKDNDEPLTKVAKETAVRVDLVVPFMPGDDLVSLGTTVRQVPFQTLPFSGVFVVNAQREVSLPKIRDALEWDCPSGYRLTHVIGEVDELGAVDEVVSKTRGDFYLVLRPGASVLDDFVSRLNAAVNVEMRTILAVRPWCGNNGLAVLRKFHVSPDVLGNNHLSVPDGPEGEEVAFRSVLGKAERYAKLGGFEGAVVDLEDLCSTS